jgi:hypothetical protein
MPVAVRRAKEREAHAARERPRRLALKQARLAQDKAVKEAKLKALVECTVTPAVQCIEPAKCTMITRSMSRQIEMSKRDNERPLKGKRQREPVEEDKAGSPKKRLIALHFWSEAELDAAETLQLLCTHRCCPSSV